MMRSALPSPNSVLARSPAWLLTVAAALVSVSWGVPALAGPNLVANGDLNHTDQDAAARVGIGEKAAYFTFDGDGDFGRVVATTTGSMTALKNELRIAYVELGKVATGGPRGLLIDTKNLKSGGDVDISVWFDLQGKIRPKKEYEWT
ncbi:MAG: hypothetical protein ACYSVY_17630, partial [Planctomycetota bacterium]